MIGRLIPAGEVRETDQILATRPDLPPPTFFSTHDEEGDGMTTARHFTPAGVLEVF